MLKKCLLLLACFFLFFSGIGFAAELTLEDLYGTWQITREDGSNPLKWDEFYRFKPNGTVDYMGNNNIRNYPFELKDKTIKIFRGPVTLNRIVKTYQKDKIMVYDTFVEMVFILTRKSE